MGIEINLPAHLVQEVSARILITRMLTRCEFKIQSFLCIVIQVRHLLVL